MTVVLECRDNNCKIRVIDSNNKQCSIEVYSINYTRNSIMIRIKAKCSDGEHNIVLSC